MTYVTYSSYLKLDQLLKLQEPRSNDPEEHDEMLFIIIHQVYELWFKQVRHEMGLLQDRLRAGDAPSALHTFKRVLTIFKTLVGQVDVLETMTPLSFASFRGRLEQSSGFQSFQFRLFEFACGHKRESVLDAFAPDTQEYQILQAALDGPCLYDDFACFLRHHDIPVPNDVLERDKRAALEPSEAMQEALLGVYRNKPDLAQVCERMVDLDEGIQEWRYRHVKMVERTIGGKMGTGGSSGAAYLRSTLFRPLFEDLWAIRSRF